MSVLSTGSQCESVAIIYTHAVTLYYTHVAISSLILCAVCLHHGSVREKAAGAFERHRNCWYSLCGDREKFYLRWYRHWRISGESGVFPKHRMNCIAFLPTDRISSCVDFSSFITLFSSAMTYIRVYLTCIRRYYFPVVPPSFPITSLCEHSFLMQQRKHPSEPLTFLILSLCLTFQLWLTMVENRNQKRCIKQIYHRRS